MRERRREGGDGRKGEGGKASNERREREEWEGRTRTEKGKEGGRIEGGGKRTCRKRRKGNGGEKERE